MNYISTRTKESEKRSAAFVIKNGLAPDGGLYVPESIPQLTTEEMDALIKMDYIDRATYILSLFLTDYTKEELKSAAEAAYSTEKFGGPAAPIAKVGGKYFLELWHGPTSAFKDMALQIMPRLLSLSLGKTGEEKDAYILVATSGDTGKAALEGYCDIDRVKIQVFYPVDGVSNIQKKQMASQKGDNVQVVAIKGNFDDAQSGVKKIFSDEEFKRTLDSEGVFLSSANSINWGRLVPQIVYYVSAYCDLYAAGKISLGEKIDVCVPTGNFGNIFAAYIAKLMGLPIEKLVCASNMNNVLTDFLKNGTYDKNRSFYATMSPSMDILISSNLERLLYVTLGAEKTAEYMEKLNTAGKYELSREDFLKVSASFVGYYTDEEKTAETIKSTFKNKNCLIDTHTAVAVSAADSYMLDYKAERKMLVVSTASAFKFANDVLSSIRGYKEDCDLSAPTELEKLTGVKMPSPLASVLNKKIVHTEVIESREMKTNTLTFAKN